MVQTYQNEDNLAVVFSSVISSMKVIVQWAVDNKHNEQV